MITYKDRCWLQNNVFVNIFKQEREQRKRIQEQRDAEEKRLRAETRRREEEYQRQEMEKRERERREQEREIRVNEERQRLENAALQQSYQPYANLPSQYPDQGPAIPPPPQRGSSYDIATRSNNGPSSYDMATRSNNGGPNSYNGRIIGEPSKKSVKFDTQLETRNTYSVASEDDSRHQSYRTNSQSSDLGSPNTMTPAGDNVVFSTPEQSLSPDRYRVSENTPTVIGAQEVYRDPRSRINAQKEAQGGGIGSKKATDRMSFREKMKFFATEAGEDTPKYKPKASKTLRNIENQLHNGQ